MSVAPAVQWSKLHDKRRMRSSQSSGIRPNQPLRKAKSRGQSGNKCVNPGRRREDLCLFIPPWVCIGPLLFYLFALSACCVCAGCSAGSASCSCSGPPFGRFGCRLSHGRPPLSLGCFVKLESGFRCPAGGAGILAPHAAVWQPISSQKVPLLWRSFRFFCLHPAIGFFSFVG